MDSIITPRNVQEIARNLGEDCAQRAAQADREARFPEADLRALKESGYLGMSVPLEYGGAGLSLRECAEAQVELARGSASTAMVTAMQLQVFGHARETRLWPEAIFAHFCRTASRDGALFNMAASEPQMGSPSRGGGYQTAARPAPGGEHFIVSGHKTRVTGSRLLTHLLVRVAVGGEPAVLWMPNDLPGMTWIPAWEHALGLRASESHDLQLENVVVPAGNLIARGDQRETPNVWFPAMLTAVYLGAALAARDALIRFALERVPPSLGKPIATLPSIQRQIGEIDAALQAAQALFRQAVSAWKGDESRRRGVFIRLAAAKHVVVGTAAQVTDQALRVAGSLALTDALPLERYFRDVRAGFAQPPSGDAALEAIGKAALDEA